MRTDFAPTLENIDLGLSQLADLIERYPDMECLWLYVDRLEAEREKLSSRHDRLAAARARVQARSQHQTATQSS